MNDINIYLDLIGKAKVQLSELGADKSECILKVTDMKEITAEACRFNLMRTMVSHNLTIRAIKNNKLGSVTINKIDEDSVRRAIESCMETIEYANEDLSNDIAPLIENKDFKRGTLSDNVDKMAERLAELADDIKREYPLIVFELGGYYNHNLEIYENSNGVRFTDENGSYNIYASFVAVQNDETTSFGPGVYFRVLDPDTRYIDCQSMRLELDKTMKLLNPKKVNDKFVGMLLATPNFTNEFFSYLSDIALKDSKIINKTSRFKNSIGLKVANDNLCYSYKPYSEDIVLGRRFTNDGYIEKDLDIIENGILKSFQLTAYGARESGLHNSCNSGQSLYIKPGEKSLDDIIKGIDKGVIIGRYSGNEPNEDGEISGIIKNGFIIENGEIVSSLDEAMISGNIFDMLMNMKEISKDCKKNGMNVLPWILFDGVTIN